MIRTYGILQWNDFSEHFTCLPTGMAFQNKL